MSTVEINPDVGHVALAAAHPLASLRTTEIEAIRRIIESRPDFSEDTRFAYVGLEEPAKADVLSWAAGNAPLPDRRARVWLHDMATGRSTDCVLSLSSGTVVSSVGIDGSKGHVLTLVSEYRNIMAALSSDERWAAALAARGLKPSEVQIMPLSAGHYGFPEDEGRRLVRCFGFKRDGGNMWAHPIDGLCVYIDVADASIQKLIDLHISEIPTESGDFFDPAIQGPPLEGLAPLVITQPEGVSFDVDDEQITWCNWKLRIGFDAREGLILRQLSFADDGIDRSIMYRGSINEMVVPYGDPSPIRFWQNYFDTGEYFFGRYVNSLTLGCDCVGEIRYFDAVFSDESGEPTVVKNAVCLHEEDYGALWKHTDIFTGAHEVRRSRRLVISSFSTLGNYDYGFFWYLYLDGTIEFEVKLTGVLWTSAYPGDNEDGSAYAYASQVAPGLGAPYHQHLFSARLDMTVDGIANVVNEVDAVRVPMSADNPAGNGFTKSITPLVSEAQSGRVADTEKNRVWQIASTEKTTRLGQPTSYVLHPRDAPTLLAAPGSSIRSRAAFATKNLFVTKYDPSERYAAGDFVNMSPGEGGIPAFISGDESIVGEDLVLWHTFGVTHFPRNEDWPVMPMAYAKFALVPYNFFSKNPALNVPAPKETSHCHAPSGDE